MPETFTKWDAAEHLTTKEDVRLYLAACAKEDPGDGSLIRAELFEQRDVLGDGHAQVSRLQFVGETRREGRMGQHAVE